MSEYSSLKVFHHQDKLQQLKEGKQIVPLHVQIFPSDLCNQACLGCSYRTPGYFASKLFSVRENEHENFNPNRMIPYEKLIEILDDCKEMGIKAIETSGGGESTIHPKAKDFFRYGLDLGLDMALVTNGMLLYKFFEELLRFKWVRVSIDAGTPTTYANYRGVSPEVYYRVWDQVEEFVRLKKDIKSDVVIGIGFVLNKDNWPEVISCTERARIAGVDNVRISGLFQSENEKYFEEFYDGAASLCRRAKDLETKKFRVFNMFGERVEDLKQHAPDYRFCGKQQFNTLIGGDQNVYRCCVVAYNEMGLIGSVKNRRFKDLWFSQEKQADFDKFDARGCPRCMFNFTNRTINYALDEKPVHVNYI